MPFEHQNMHKSAQLNTQHPPDPGEAGAAGPNRLPCCAPSLHNCLPALSSDNMRLSSSCSEAAHLLGANSQVKQALPRVAVAAAQARGAAAKHSVGVVEKVDGSVSPRRQVCTHMSANGRARSRWRRRRGAALHCRRPCMCSGALTRYAGVGRSGRRPPTPAGGVRSVRPRVQVGTSATGTRLACCHQK
jgi:hypothetical protein